MLRRVSPWLMLLILSGTLADAATDKPRPQPKDDYYELYKVLVDTMDQVERNYVKEVDRRELMEAAIKGVLGKLDPYSSYIPPDELSRFRATVDSEFGGIGIQIGVEGGQLKILSPLAGTPAYRAGLLAGDRIVAIEGKSTEGITIDDAVARLKGKEGTKVTITVIHPGKTDKHEVTVTREKIHVETVLGDRRKIDDSWDFMFDAKQRIGYLRVTAFSRDTAAELRRALEQLKGEKMRALILDLRFNPGGLLSSAIEVSNLFIAKGRIVSTKGRNSPERVWDAHKNGAYEGFPMVILVNRYSASASEIVSACLQDHKRAVIMGERTWGKGSVQNVVELENGRSALKLTTASYRRPSGKNIHRFEDAKETDEWGVTPDKGHDLKLGDSEMVNLLEDRRQRDVVQPHDAPQAKPEAEKKTEPNPNGNGKSKENPAPKANGKPPAEKPAAQKPPAEKPAAKEKPGTGLDEPPFVDRQLQMAVKYLTGQLARSK
jgi:carboxyl-terminal processing protease